MDPRGDHSSENNEAFYHAVQGGFTKIVKILLCDPRVVPTRDGAAIRNAAQNWHYDLLKILLSDSMVDPSVNDNEAVRCAVRLQSLKGSVWTRE